MLIKPILTEKSLAMVKKGRYTFSVLPYANKTQIKMAAKKMFGVDVTAINTLRMPGKKYRTGKRGIKNLRAEWKKAILKLKPGQSIGLFELPAEEQPVKKD